ncbi:hypothetical protein DUI87_14591 [Hirundo rustica rustica]|uniref:Uncharacterized protein n=1 Tax=Hirundo rustica rustica TaxID=333673 RepID=A0A3M0K573_HIRRU|nr:hypothetical protein DUI87_14591 [Hirundo rustica rustica]
MATTGTLFPLTRQNNPSLRGYPELEEPTRIMESNLCPSTETPKMPACCFCTTVTTMVPAKENMKNTQSGSCGCKNDALQMKVVQVGAKTPEYEVAMLMQGPEKRHKKNYGTKTGFTAKPKVAKCKLASRKKSNCKGQIGQGLEQSGIEEGVSAHGRGWYWMELQILPLCSTLVKPYPEQCPVLVTQTQGHGTVGASPEETMKMLRGLEHLP